jgi:hypothetical protein
VRSSATASPGSPPPPAPRSVDAGQLVEGVEPATFWVWVDPDSPTLKQRLERRAPGDPGSFGSAAGLDAREAVLPFVHNPAFSGELSPFALNVLHEYAAEYALELHRARHCAHCPSRLCAIFLLRSHDEAVAYGDRHARQVDRRVLVPVQTVGGWRASVHDSRWIDRLRAHRGLGPREADRIAGHYWRGDACDGHGPPVYEVLLLGRIAFRDGLPSRGASR